MISFPTTASFSHVLSSACAGAAGELGGRAAGIFLYDDVAKGFSLASTFPTGHEVAGTDVPLRHTDSILHALRERHGDLLHADEVSAAFGDSALVLGGDEDALLCALTGKVPVGAILISGPFAVDLAETAEVLENLARVVTEAIMAIRPATAGESWFQHMVEADSAGVLIVDGDQHTCTYASVSFRETHGCVDVPLVGRPLHHIVSADIAAQMADVLVEARATRQNAHIRGIEIADEYGTRFYDAHVVPQLPSHGNGSCLYLIMRSRTGANVTRQAFESTIVQLAESQSLLAALLDATANGIMFAGADGTVMYVNQKMEELLGASLPRMLGRPGTEVAAQLASSAVDPNAVLQRMLELHADQQTISVDEFDVYYPTDRVLSRYSAPVLNDDRSFVGRIDVYADVTDARQLQRNKDHFLSLVSHELRTPVTSIKGYAQLLQRRARKENPSDQTLVAYQTIERQSARMQKLIDLLLDLSRLESGRMQLAIDHVNLSDLVGRAADMVQITTEEHRIVLELPARSVWIEGDEQRLDQVLTNLLTNAVRFSPEGGTITVTLTQAQDAIHLVVRDRGRGIRHEAIPHIFERFYHDGPPVESAGMGVGLYITHGIVERHGGHIEVESTLDVGSTFTVHLPLTQKKSDETAT